MARILTRDAKKKFLDRLKNPRGFFWLGIAIVFLAMTCQTIWVRQVIVPQAIEESRGSLAAINGLPLPDLRKLRPIFDHTLIVEIMAFVLTAIAAFVDFLEPRHSKE